MRRKCGGGDEEDQGGGGEGGDDTVERLSRDFDSSLCICEDTFKNTSTSGRNEPATYAKSVIEALREIIVWPQIYGDIAEALVRERSGDEVDVLSVDAEGVKELNVKSNTNKECSINKSNVTAAFQWRWPHGALLHGPAGVGKTYAVRTVAREVIRNDLNAGESDANTTSKGAHVIVVTPEMISGNYVGDSENKIKQIFQQAKDLSREAALAVQASPSEIGPPPVIILLENVDVICPPRNSMMQHEARLVAQLLLLLDSLNDDFVVRSSLGKAQSDGEDLEENHDAFISGGRVVVIATTDKPNCVDEALRRPGRLEKEISFHMPDVKQRLDILLQSTTKLPLHTKHSPHTNKDSIEDEWVDFNSIAQSCTGYTAADLRALTREALTSAIKRCRGHGEELLVIASDFWKARDVIPPSVSRTLTSDFRPVSWSDIGGVDNAKKILKQSLLWPLSHPSTFKRLGIRPPRGILLYGPPGCSKTSLALCGATAASVPFFQLDCASLYSMWVGEGESRLRELFRQARLAAPSIIFMDEIDAALPKRNFSGRSDSADHGNAGMRLLTTLLTEIDGLDSNKVDGVVLLAATNRPWDIDPALMRPGRIDIHCFVPLPDLRGRHEILKLAAKDMPIKDTKDTLRLVSERTDLYSGAELISLCREAAMNAIRNGSDEIDSDHFNEALRDLPPSTTLAQLESYKNFQSK